LARRTRQILLLHSLAESVEVEVSALGDSIRPAFRYMAGRVAVVAWGRGYYAE
jgi:hypothetical protein